MKLLILLLKLASLTSGFLATISRTRTNFGNPKNLKNILQCRSYSQKGSDTIKPGSTGQESKRVSIYKYPLYISDGPSDESNKPNSELQVNSGPKYSLNKRALNGVLWLSIAFFFVLLMEKYFTKRAVNELQKALEEMGKELNKIRDTGSEGSSPEDSAGHSEKGPTDHTISESDQVHKKESPNLKTDYNVHRSFSHS